MLFHDLFAGPKSDLGAFGWYQEGDCFAVELELPVSGQEG